MDGACGSVVFMLLKVIEVDYHKTCFMTVYYSLRNMQKIISWWLKIFTKTQINQLGRHCSSVVKWEKMNEKERKDPGFNTRPGQKSDVNTTPWVCWASESDFKRITKSFLSPALKPNKLRGQSLHQRTERSRVQYPARAKKWCKHGPLSLLGIRARLIKDNKVLFKSGSEAHSGPCLHRFFCQGQGVNPISFCSFSFIFSYFTTDLQRLPLWLDHINFPPNLRLGPIN